MDRPPLILASASPRRRELLKQLGYHCEVRPVAVDETPRDGESPQELVTRLAREKARTAVDLVRGDAPVLAADTVVVVDDEVLGKPRDREDCVRMLMQLSDRVHQVLTWVCVADTDGEELAGSQSDVRFRRLEPEECEAYWATEEPRDKAGGYAIQGLAAAFVRHLEGSYSGVMGLPLYETAELLARRGLAPPFLRADAEVPGR